MASAQHTTVIDNTAVIPTRHRYTPVRDGDYVEITAFGGAGVLYGATFPHRNTNQYVRYDVPAAWGQTVTENDDANIADAFIEPGVSLGRDETLSVIVLINGNPIERVAKGTVPTAGKFRVYDNASVITVQFGTNYAVGTKIEILLIGSAATASTGVTDINDGSALVSGLPQQVVTQEFLFADTAPIIMRALGATG